MVYDLHKYSIGLHTVFLNSDRSHSRSASAVRDAKGFVKIQMRDITAVIA